MTEIDTLKMSQIVQDAGGIYIGIQTPLFCDGGALDQECIVLFKAHVSANPVYLPLSQMTPENVKQKLGGQGLGKNVTKFHKMENHMSVGSMKSLAERLEDLTETVKAHIRWMEETQ